MLSEEVIIRSSRLDHVALASMPAAVVLAVVLASCAGPSAPTEQPSPSLGVTPPHLGPTSTSRPLPATIQPGTPTPTLIPLSPVTPADLIRGPVDAPASILVYCDFQAPACARLASVMNDVLSAHPRDLNLIYRQVPLIPSNDKASLAAQAAQAAGEQGWFWEMYDVLYQRRDEWVDLPPDGFRTWLVSAGEALGLDTQRFQEDLDSPENVAIQAQAYANAVSTGIPSVPFIFLNGDLYRLGLDRPSLEAAVRLAVLSTRRFEAYPPMVIDPDRQYTAHLVLNIGEVVVQLLPQSAPIAVNSFVYLAQQGWYDESPVFRVVPGRLIEAGDPSGTGIGDAGYFFETEFDPALSYDRAGVVGMSNSGAETNSSIFFITLSPVAEFNGERTIFGRVIKGLELLQVLDKRDPLIDLLEPPQAKLLRLSIEVK